MKIEILGTRGEIESTTPYHSKHSGILIDSEILVDLGEKEYLEYNPKCIFITHLHPDHAIFITEEIGEINVPVYAPELSDKLQGIRKISESVKINSYKILPIPTIHSKLVKSVGYLIEKDNRKVLYTGDMIWIKKEYHNKIKDLDLVITDGSFIRDKGMIRRDKDTGQIYGHNGIPNLVKLFNRFTKHIVFTHFGEWFYKDVGESRKKIASLENDVKLDVAYDGMVIEV